MMVFVVCKLLIPIKIQGNYSLHVEAILLSIAAMAMMETVMVCASDLHINNGTNVKHRNFYSKKLFHFMCPKSRILQKKRRISCEKLLKMVSTMKNY